MPSGGHCKIVTAFCIWTSLFCSCPVPAFMPASLLLHYGVMALRQRASGPRDFSTKFEQKDVFPNKLMGRIFFSGNFFFQVVWHLSRSENCTGCVRMPNRFILLFWSIPKSESVSQNVDRGPGATARSPGMLFIFNNTITNVSNYNPLSSKFHYFCLQC